MGTAYTNQADLLEISISGDAPAQGLEVMRGGVTESTSLGGI